VAGLTGPPPPIFPTHFFWDPASPTDSTSRLPAAGNHQQNLRGQVRRHPKRQPHIHPAGIGQVRSPVPTTGVSMNFSVSAKATISWNPLDSQDLRS